MTFKQITIALFSLLIISQTITFVILFKEDPLVYVDTNLLLENYDGMKAARQEFQQKAAVWQANMDTLKAELEASLRKYETDKPGMTAKEKELNEELLKAKQQQFIDYQNGIQQRSQQEDYEMTQQVLTQVNTFIEAYGKRKGYTIILGANSSGNIVYAEEHLDITEELQKELNESYLGF